MARNYVALPANRAAQAVPCVGCGTSVIPSPSARPYEGDGLIALDHHPLRVGLEAAYCPDSGVVGDEDLCHRPYDAEFCIFAGDALTVLSVHLTTQKCKDYPPDFSNLQQIPLNLAGYKYITLYARKINDHEQTFFLHGLPRSPLYAGEAIFFFTPGVLDCISGEWEGEVEVEYKNGKIVTAFDKVKFHITEDFAGHGSEEGHPKCHELPAHLPSFVEDALLPSQLPVMDVLSARQQAVFQREIAMKHGVGLCCNKSRGSA